MRRNAARTAAALLAALALLAAAAVRTAGAGTSLQVPVGARAAGMGYAFSAVADDATALYWNPAGLPWIGHQEITGSHANLFGSDINDNYASFVLPLTPRIATGIDWYHSGYDDTELGFGENRIDLSYGQRLLPFLSAGATVKYLTRNTDLDGVSVRSGDGASLDLGLLATPWPGLRLSAVAQDLFDARISYSGGQGMQVVYRRTTKVGAAFSPRNWITGAVDVDDRLHAGVEYRPVEALALRTGFTDDVSGPDGLSASFGAGLRWSIFRFDYALVTHPTLGETSHFGLSLAFNFNPSQVRIEKVDAQDLYASLYRTYAREPFGVLHARNLDDKPLSARVRVFVPGMMDTPSEQEVVLRPRAAQEVPLTAVFADRVLQRQGDRPVQVEVTTTYQSLRLPRTEKGSGRCIAYGPGAVDWSAGVAQAAAFVTTRDPVVEAVAREATRTVALMRENPLGIRNLAFTAAIIDALGTLGIAYVPDPNNPYATISGLPHAVDTVGYPSQTLARGSGDCDDTTVLVAALLGNVGIATQIVDVPGHLFLLADAGVHERNRLALGLEEERYVVADDEVWVPIETTAIGEGFAEAWRVGAESYAAWASRGRVKLVDLAEAQARFEPGEVAPTLGAPRLDTGDLRTRLAADLMTIAGWRERFLERRFGDVRRGIEIGASALNEVAQVQFLAGKWEETRASLETALTKEPGAARLVNNLGLVRAALGDPAGAAGLFDAALRADPSDAGIWLNLGLARYAAGDTRGADDALARGLERAGGYAEACQLLGLAPGEELERGAGPKVTAEEARQLLKAALLKVPAGAGTPSKAPALKPPTPKRKWTSRIAAGRGEEEAALGSLLYWKP